MVWAVSTVPATANGILLPSIAPTPPIATSATSATSAAAATSVRFSAKARECGGLAAVAGLW